MGSSNKKIPVAPKNILIGMTSKDGINFFPEEFIAMPKKCKKQEDNIMV